MSNLRWVLVMRSGARAAQVGQRVLVVDQHAAFARLDAHASHGVLSAACSSVEDLSQA